MVLYSIIVICYSIIYYHSVLYRPPYRCLLTLTLDSYLEEIVIICLPSSIYFCQHLEISLRNRNSSIMLYNYNIIYMYLFFISKTLIHCVMIRSLLSKDRR